MATELTTAQRKAGADRVREWANPRVFASDQCDTIRTWADQLFAHGETTELTPKWPSRLRSTQATREATARRLFREGTTTSRR